MNNYTHYKRQKIYKRLAKILPKKYPWFPVNQYINWMDHKPDDGYGDAFEELLDFMFQKYPDYGSGYFFNDYDLLDEDTRISDDYTYNVDLMYLDTVLRDYPEKVKFILL